MLNKSLLALIGCASATQLQYSTSQDGLSLVPEDIQSDLLDISMWLGASPTTWGSGLGPKNDVFSFLTLLETDIDAAETTCSSSSSALSQQLSAATTGINNNVAAQAAALQGADSTIDLTDIHVAQNTQFDILFDILQEIWERSRWTNDRLAIIEIALGDFYVLDAGVTYESDVRNIQVADAIFHP